MSIYYTLSYIELPQRFGFFRRRSRRIKCEVCKDAHAVILITSNINPDIKINLCVECYNSNPTEQLLERVANLHAFSPQS